MDERGGFAVGSDSSAVTAFVDTSGDGRYDPFAEPSPHCARQGDAWRCDLGRTRIAAHRVATGLVENIGTIVPIDALDDCDGCKLMLQIADVVDQGEVGTYSEARFAIARSAS